MWELKGDRHEPLHRILRTAEAAAEAAHDMVAAKMVPILTADGFRQGAGFKGRERRRLSRFLLRHGCHYGRPPRIRLHRRWRAALKFEQAAHHLVLEDYIQAVEAAVARRSKRPWPGVIG